MSARDAVATVEMIVQSMRGAEADIANQVPTFATARDALVEAALTDESAGLLKVPFTDIYQRVDDRLGRQMRVMMQAAAQGAALRRLWQRYRIVYDIDQGLWAELGDTEPSSTVPVNVFTHLPHPDPFIAFPEPLVLPLDENRRQRVAGFFVHGRAPVIAGQQLIASTSHPALESLGLAFAGVIETNAGQIQSTDGVPDLAWTMVTLDPRIGEHTVGEMAETAIGEVIISSPMEHWTGNVRLMMSRAVSLLVYLCATNADLSPLPRQTSAGTKRSKPGKDRARAPKPSKVIGVGYRIGAQLAAYRRHEQAQHAAASTGRKRAPHVRRAHFHTYWTGPRDNQQAEVRWLPPIPVNVTGDATQSTVVPVRKRA